MPAEKEVAKLAVPLFFQTIEETEFSKWIRESPNFFAFYGILTFHALGLVMIVGPAVVIGLRILGVASDIALAPMKKLFPIIWAGLWLNVISGLLLFYAYPTKEITNWTFYVKLVCVLLAALATRKIQKKMSDPSLNETAIAAQSRSSAFAMLVFWGLVISIGKFLPYTYIYLFYGMKGSG